MENLKAGEFRIKNLVKYDNRIFEIYSIADIFPTLNTDEFGIGVVDWNNIEPIPLTEDILLKCGFEFRNTQCQYGWHLVLAQNRVLAWCHSKEISLEFDKDTHDYNNTLFDFKCEYLHELQNLVAILTNTELTIKL